MQKVAIVALAALCATTQGVAIKWTGIVNDQQWSTPNNWYPAQVPGPNDDVTIDDAEGKDATVVLVNPYTIGSLSMGNTVVNHAHLRVLSGLTVQRSVSVQQNGNLEINSGAAGLACGEIQVFGELSFFAGTLTGSATITSAGLANFGQQSAKVFDAATVKVLSTKDVIAAGSLQFKGNSSVTATSGVQANGNNYQVIVMDKSTKNSFVTGGFAWTQ
eukprot:Rhum_TRINITY_DN14862_c0_g1::Rhum_TRINITY_DN14862_c0_g1_i5::g.124470::m.124470